jgi:hypothetical protein
VDGLLKEVAERTTHRTASITGQSSVVWLSLNLDSENLAALCSGSQEDSGIVWLLLHVPVVLLRHKTFGGLFWMTKAHVGGFLSRVCKGAVKVHLVSMGVRIVGHMLDDAFDVMQTRTAALTTSVRADSAGLGSCF